MPEKISILKESGETLSSNVVSVFMIPDTGKKYIITTENAVDPHGLTVLHVSEMNNGTLQRVATDEEWSSIKTIMRAIISGNVGSYQYLPTVENISALSQYSRDISVSASASKQMIDNYAAGDKNESPTGGEAPAPDSNNVAMGVNPNVAPVNTEMVPQPSSIFPADNAPVNNEDELIPGIAEVSSESPVSPVVSPTVEVAPSTSVGVPPISPIDPAMNINPGLDQNVAPVSNMQGIVPPTVGLDGTGLMSQPEVNNVPTTLEVASPIGIGEPAIAPVGLNPEPVASEVQNAGIQIAGPTQIVPTAQIVQEAQPNDIKFDQNATPSFNPNATLDEVVIGAQEMFMEGVKNLVQTIQEKVYRDLYNKEAELKQREADLLQKEQMINSQMMLMMNNFAASQMNNQMTMMPQQPTQTVPMGVPPVSTVQTTTPVQSVIPPIISGHTVVSAANDVI